MFVVKASGEDYENHWVENLFCTDDKALADLFVEYFELNRRYYLDAKSVYKTKLDAFLKNWKEKNPEPEVELLPRPQKPTSPHHPQELKSLSQKQKKDHPVQKAYLKALDNFQLDLKEWKDLDKKLRKQEFKPCKDWSEAYKKAEEEFKKDNFSPSYTYPPGWENEFKRYIKYCETADNFSIEEIQYLTTKEKEKEQK